jgi:hypothetical protein
MQSFEYQLHELWLWLGMNAIFQIPPAWALICTAAYSEADLYAIFEYQLQELWLTLWTNALFEAWTAAYSEADLNAIFEYELHEL